MNQLYKSIRVRRLELGMSQEELAQKVGYTDRTSIAKIEAGKVEFDAGYEYGYEDGMNGEDSNPAKWY